MLLQNIRAKIGARLNGDNEAGFTLIELLVVMLILGILAAIALPAFFNQKDKAGDAKAKEYAHSAQVAMETYYTDNGTYVGATDAKLKVIEPSLNSISGTIISGTPTESAYKITITGSKSTQNFSIANSSGTLSFTCNVKGTGGCPNKGATAEGEWGG